MCNHITKQQPYVKITELCQFALEEESVIQLTMEIDCMVTNRIVTYDIKFGAISSI